MRLLILLALASCTAIETGAGHVAEFVACPTDLIDCGHEGGDAVALAELEFGTCAPTPRHQGLCIWCCGSDCGRGANAFNGTFCPQEKP